MTRNFLTVQQWLGAQIATARVRIQARAEDRGVITTETAIITGALVALALGLVVVITNVVTSRQGQISGGGGSGGGSGGGGGGP